MNILIVGAGSKTASIVVPMLVEEMGASLTLLTSQSIQVEGPGATVHTLDINDRVALKHIIMSTLPEVIINLAALTNVDACERERALCWQVNVTLVENLARYARLVDAHLIHVSTDYVFDGQKGPYAEHDAVAPISYYGKSKLAGENALAAAGIDWTVLRTNVVYGAPSPSMDFVRFMLARFDANEAFPAATDQYSNPTYVDDLAECIMKAAQRRRTGLYHVGGADYCSRYDMACMAAKVFKSPADLVIPVTTEALGQAAKRPLRGGLVPLKAETEFRMRMTGLEAGLVAFRHRIFHMQQHPMQR
jgi:dTDP-4-dehydrorhamnose reductase